MISAFVALYYNETKEAIAFFLTSSIFFLVGFPLNALSEIKDLNFTQSLFLLFLTFIVLGLIGSVPYIYLDVFSEKSFHEKIVNSIFESVSGFTTTGFSLLNSDEIQLSNSLIFYRSLTQFIGGVGIVYILITFLYSSRYKILKIFNKILGFDNNYHIKKNFLEVLMFYSISLVILTSIMYYFSGDFIKSFSLIASGIATGGFAHYDLSSISTEEKFIVMVSMILGSISIFVLAKLKKEIVPFLLFILLTFILLTNFGINYEDALFHSVSLVSTTGYSYIDFSNLPSYVLLFLSVIMLIGGMSVSTAGGFKIIRLLNVLNFIKEGIKSFILDKEEIKINETLIFSVLYVILYLIFVGILTFIFSLYGFDISKSFFDAASSLSTSGFSVGIINDNLPLELKIIIIFYMILARVEILPLFSIFFIGRKNYE